MDCVIDTIAEIACSEISSNAIDEISKKTKIPPFHIILHIEGLAHNHPPCDYEVKNCVYCKRNGNIFSDNTSKIYKRNEKITVISKYKSKIISILEELYNEITTLAKASVINAYEDDKIDENGYENEDEREIETSEGINLELLLEKVFELTPNN